jgi:hypothetical protein
MSCILGLDVGAASATGILIRLPDRAPAAALLDPDEKLTQRSIQQSDGRRSAEAAELAAEIAPGRTGIPSSGRPSMRPN